MNSAEIVDVIIFCSMSISFFMGFIAGEMLIWTRRIYWS